MIDLRFTDIPGTTTTFYRIPIKYLKDKNIFSEGIRF